MIQRSTIVDKLKYLLKIPDATRNIEPGEIVLRAREILADTIVPYRWGDEQLSEFINDGVSEIKNLRADVERMTAIPHSFTSALSNYAVYRAFSIDNDAQNNNGAISDKYMNLFREQASAIKYFFTEEDLTEFIAEAVNLIIARRPELRIAADGSLKTEIIVNEDYDLPERFTDVIVDGAGAKAAAHSKNEMAQYYSDKFAQGLQTI